MNPARLFRHAARVEGERRARPLNTARGVEPSAIDINDELDLFCGNDHAARVMLIPSAPHETTYEIAFPGKAVDDFIKAAGRHPKPELFAVRQMHFDHAVDAASIRAQVAVAKIDLIHEKAP